ncbi:restriction endonuclease subunit S [Natranaerobius trueperi]|uniref:Type I restriction modification DNA specificity domain-containing protein n=1 Tax=Natranaerobius trueperi TaxID=759412 RepID=A0A226BZ37_9FIRM|nr:restriction endonuclease subunit S [Natranaerobius trueperi]OWZ84293.1 hypothetical protein CDO51_04335 [Natranaerobius trueperi]
MTKKKSKSIEELLEEAIVPHNEQPYEVPNSWVWIPLKYIVNFYSGSAFPKKYQGNHGLTYSFYKVGNLKYVDKKYFLNKSDNTVDDEIIKQTKAKLVPKSAIVFAKIGEAIKLNRRGLLPNDSCIDNNLMAIKNKEDIVEIMFLFFWTLKTDFYQYTQASAIPSIRKSTMEKIYFPLPPMNEQKRIANKVDRLLNKIDKAKDLIEEAKETFELRRAALLDKAFKGELTRKWREKNPEVESAELLVKTIHENKSLKRNIYQERSHELPRGWIYTRMGEVVDINPPKKKLNEISDEYNCSFLPMTSVDGEYGTIENIEERPYSKVKKGYKFILEDDVIFARITPCMENGKSAIVKGLKNGFGFGSTEFHILRTNNYINNKFIHYFIHSKTFRNKAKAVMTGAVGQQRVSKDFLENYIIALPPLKEQEEIVRMLDVILDKEYKVNNIIDLKEKCDLIKHSILSKAFKGELGTNDPTEGSAIELLKEALEEKGD